MGRKREQRTSNSDRAPNLPIATAAPEEHAEANATAGASSVAENLTPLLKQILRQGWISIAVWMTFGLLLEGLLGFKTPAYLLDSERRELFRLAHAHGTLLGLLLIAAVLSSSRFLFPPAKAALHALRLGALLMPLGFLFGGLWHYESDPGLGIWLVPPGALLVIFGVVAIAVSSLAALRDKN